MLDDNHFLVGVNVSAVSSDHCVEIQRLSSLAISNRTYKRICKCVACSRLGTFSNVIKLLLHKVSMVFTFELPNEEMTLANVAL